MNLVTVGRRTINMDLVAMIEDRRGDPGGPGDGVTITFAIGGTLELAGDEADALRRFIGSFSRSPDAVLNGPPGFSREKLPDTPGDVERRKQGN